MQAMKTTIRLMIKGKLANAPLPSKSKPWTSFIYSGAISTTVNSVIDAANPEAFVAQKEP